jgi:hypothetical protein
MLVCLILPGVFPQVLDYRLQLLPLHGFRGCCPSKDGKIGLSGFFVTRVLCGTPPARLIAFFEKNIDRKKVSTDHVVPDIEMHQVLFKRLCI